VPLGVSVAAAQLKGVMRKLNPWTIADGLFVTSERDKRLLYIFITPLLIPVFTMVYSILLLLIVTLIALPFGNAANPHLDAVGNIVIVVSVIFSIITVIKMWRGQKNGAA
jgi:hypothetical protein